MLLIPSKTIKFQLIHSSRPRPRALLVTRAYAVIVGAVRYSMCTLISQCICKTCSRVLLHEAPRVKYLKRMRNPRGMGALERGNLHKKIITECKKATICFNESCYAVNGTVKKVWVCFASACSFKATPWLCCAS